MSRPDYEKFRDFTPFEEQLIYNKLLQEYGPSAQIRMFVEECAEAIAQIMQYYERGRGSLDDVASELADVSITLAQVTKIVNNEAGENLVDNYKQVKLARVNNRVNLINTIEDFKK